MPDAENSGIRDPGGEDYQTLVTKLITCSNSGEVVKQYDHNAYTYDEAFTVEVYAAPRLTAEAVLRMYPENGPVPRSQVKVMDIAAGTGLVGKRLRDAGITSLDALDPSSKMMEIARSQGIYQRFIQDVIGEHKIAVEDATYDAVVVAGGFSPGHCPLSALDEMIRICKPGGYIVNSMRYEYLVTAPEYHGLEDRLNALERAGVWRRVERFITDRYFGDTKQGITYVYQKA